LGIFALLSLLAWVFFTSEAFDNEYYPFHNHPVLDYVSESRVQKGGIISTPKGEFSAVNLAFINKDG
jgi:hypothetical protein